MSKIARQLRLEIRLEEILPNGESDSSGGNQASRATFSQRDDENVVGMTFVQFDRGARAIILPLKRNSPSFSAREENQSSRSDFSGDPRSAIDPGKSPARRQEIGETCLVPRSRDLSSFPREQIARTFSATIIRARRRGFLRGEL